MTTYPRDPVAVGLLGRTRAALLSLLLSHADEWFHLRQIARECATSPGTAHRELQSLVALGLVIREPGATSVRFKANMDAPVFPELKGLLAKTAGALPMLRECMVALDNAVRAAFVYGSVARGEEKAGSDIDLMVVGSVTLAAVLKALRPAAQELRREVNPTVYTTGEFARKAQEGHSFIRRVLAEPKVFLIGDERELGKLGEDREAASPRPAAGRDTAAAARSPAKHRRRPSPGRK
jgi:predicted nucleotidyltransferase